MKFENKCSINCLASALERVSLLVVEIQDNIDSLIHLMLFISG